MKMNGPINPNQFGMMFTTEEIYTSQKKAKNESNSPVEKHSSSFLGVQSKDTSAISEQAQQQAENEKLQEFRNSAIKNLSNLDENSEDFLEQATDKIVESALKKEFGSKMAKNKGFSAMKSNILKQILENDEKREKIETFINDLMPSVKKFVHSGEEKN